ncbi:hypothetical protein D3C73_1201860 [compost metagenome]
MPQTRRVRQKPPGLLGEIQKNGARLEQGQRLAASDRHVIHKGRQATVGVDGAELGSQVPSFEQVVWDNAVLQPRLGEHDRHLVPIGRVAAVQIDQDQPP